MQARKYHKPLPCVERMVADYRASGRLAFIRPYRAEISLNGGRGLPYQVAYNQMSECLNAESLKQSI